MWTITMYVVDIRMLYPMKTKSRKFDLLGSTETNKFC